MPDGLEKFERCHEVVLREEGGLAHLPGDSGGLTNFGITQVAYDRYLGRNEQSSRSVEGITEEEVQDIYYNDYWEPSLAEAMNWPLCLAHYHFFVNARPVSAFKVLQRALDVSSDGVVGRQTRAAIELANGSYGATVTAAFALLLEQVAFYDTLDEGDPAKTKFLTELWLKRVKHIYRECKKPFTSTVESE